MRYKHRILSLIMSTVLLMTFCIPASATGFDNLSTVVDMSGQEQFIPEDTTIIDESSTDTLGNEPSYEETPEEYAPSAQDKVNESDEEASEPVATPGVTGYGVMPDGYTFQTYADAPYGIMPFSDTSTTVSMTRNDFIHHRYPFKGGTSMFPAYIFRTSDGRAAYCVEPAKWNSTNNKFMTGSLTFSSLSTAKQAEIAKAIAANTSGTSNPAMYMATQVIIWEIAYGEKHKSGSVYAAVVTANAAQLASAYDSILSAMQSMSGDIPSFMSTDRNSPTLHAMTDGGGSWSIDLANTNGNVTLNASNFKSKANFTYSVSGNTLTVTSPSEPDSDSFVEWNSSGDGSAGLVFWVGNEQAKVSKAETGGIPSAGFMAFNSEAVDTEKEDPEDQKIGYLQIFKYDGETSLPLGGAVFRIECDGFIDEGFPVPYGGATVVIPIPEGQDSVDVTVTEVTAPYLYVGDPSPKTVTVYASDIVNISQVAFVNYPQACSLTIYKYEKGNYGIPLSGAKFRIRYADPGVSAQVWTLTTDSSGTIKIDLPAAGTLIIEELEAPAGYVIGQTSTWEAVVAKGEHKQVDISNDKKADIIAYKKDAQTRQLLSGATIKATLLRAHTEPFEQNAVYTGTTDANGRVVFSNMIPGEYRIEVRP